MTPPITARSGPRNPREDLYTYKAYFDAVPYDPSKEEKEQAIVEPEVVENNAAKEVLAVLEPPKSVAAEPEVKEKSTATKVLAASCECIINSLTSSVREEMKCVYVCH